MTSTQGTKWLEWKHAIIRVFFFTFLFFIDTGSGYGAQAGLEQEDFPLSML
jgi:hypothetical protein